MRLQDLKAAVSLAAKAAKTHGLIHLVSSGERLLVAGASGAGWRIGMTLPTVDDGEWSVATDSRELRDAMEDLPAGEVVVARDPRDSGQLLLTVEGMRRRVGVTRSEAPTFPVAEKEVDAGAWAHALDATIYAAAVDKARSVLQAVYVDDNHLVASDNYRIAVQTLPFALRASAIVPLPAAAAMRQALRRWRAPTVRLDIHFGELLLWLPGEVSVRMVAGIDGSYPDYERIVDAPPLQAGYLVGKTWPRLGVTHIHVRCRDGEPTEFVGPDIRGVLDGAWYVGQPAEFAINPRHLADLAVHGSVTISVPQDPLAPLAWRGEACRGAIMPVRCSLDHG